MSIKTFVDNTPLPASDINTYLANSGLVYVKSQTVGTTVSSVTVSAAFSTDYDNYRVIYTGGVGSGTTTLRLSLSGNTTGYYGGLFATNYSNGAFVGGGNNNLSYWDNIGYMSAAIAVLSADIYMPYVSGKRKNVSSYTSFNSNGYGMFHGECTATASSTDLTITPGSGTLTGGTITVYGYRKA